ncbi:8133_t:CDS:2 [Paraglomus occultum]|uniref:8133_t:CDS:1 n=1 Tax=Paraglomus occultum TaxID=144539 RepID=A0A9N9GAA6_9GLOM|nr:8133_t:CDS:2 [Paraglomus occultum]
MTLKEVRKELSVNDENGKCIMEDDMLFCDLNNAQIRQIDEGKYYLGIILNEMNVICITRCKTLEEVIPHLIRQRKLDCGIRWTESGPAQSDNVAFKFKSYAVMGDRIEYIERAFEQTNNRKRSVLCENGIEWKLDLKTLWQSTGLGAHFTNERSNESSTNHRKYRHVQRHIRATLFMKSEHIEPSDNFKNEVEEAVGLLDLGAKSAKLKEICEKYGYFWAREVHLGGMIINTEEERENANVQSARRRGGLDINMKTGPSELRSGISQNNDRLNQNSSSNANTKFTVIGGDLNTYIHPGDESKWHRTLQDSSTWEIIHYEDIVPIYEIFEERIQNAIREIFRAKVCYSGIDVLDLQEKNFCIRPIRFPPNVWEGIRQHQIFAEVMYEGEPDTMFAANIEQTEGLPNVRVSKIQASGSRNYNFFRKKSKLKLAYIITGYPKSSDSQTKDELSVEVAVVQGEKKNDKFVASLPEVTNIQGFYQKAVLITCYITQQTMLAMQKTGSKRRDSDNCIVFTMHLHKPDDVRPTEPTVALPMVLTK